MANYGYIISAADANIQQFDHDTETSIRALGTYNGSWSPFFTTNFDPSTGLPLEFALGPEETQNPCSITTDDVSVYILDTMTCRVLRFSQNGTLHQTFGGKRGIGTGRITPDALMRSIIAIANDFTWFTDNEGGFLVQYESIGPIGIIAENTFKADHSISALSSAAGVTFDQITGITWDSARQKYWILASGSANTYLVELDENVSPTGYSIDLTSLSGIAGHSNSPSNKTLTRGLKHYNGLLYLWSADNIYKIDPKGPSSEILYTGISNLSPGHINSGGTEITASIQGAPNGTDTFAIIDLQDGSLLRSYALSDNSPDGGVGDVSSPWDNSVLPFNEQSINRVSAFISARASIKNSASQTISAKANILNSVQKSISILARILLGAQNQLSAKAHIEEPSTVADSQVESWNISDTFGNFSQSFGLTSRVLGNFKPGSEITIYAGYDGNRVKMITGRIDNISKSRKAGERIFTMSGRNQGAQEYGATPITKVFNATPPSITPRAHDIIRESAAEVGLSIGVLEFPDYPLFNSYNVIGKRISQIVQEITEPWNLFQRIQYIGIIRNHKLSIIKVDWQNPPNNGYLVEQKFHQSQDISQEDYLDEPRLNNVKIIKINGATYTKPTTDLGTQTIINYQRNHVDRETIRNVSGKYDDFLQLEQETIETVQDGKILTRIQTTYRSIGDGSGNFSDWAIFTRNTEQNIYFWPPSAIRGQEAGEIPNLADALLAATFTAREGFDEDIANSIFREQERNLTEFFYNDDDEIVAQVDTTEARDTDTGEFLPAKAEMRTFSKTTSGTTRVELTVISVDNDEPDLNKRLSVDSVSLQQVGGERASLNNPSARGNLISVQEQFPSPSLDPDGNPIDVGEGETIWSYDNPYLGPDEVETIFNLANDEKEFQTQGYKWEIVPFSSSFNPNIHIGQGVRVEIDNGVFKDYWVETVRHSWTTNSALTNGVAKRLTLDSLEEDA